MASKSKDEEYLDSLLNSVVSNDVNQDDASDDFDKWFDEELKNIDVSGSDMDIDESEDDFSDIFNEPELGNYETELQSDDGKQNDLEYVHEEPEDEPGDEPEEEPEDEPGDVEVKSGDIPDISVDGNEIDVNDITEEEDLEGLLDLIDSNELQNMEIDSDKKTTSEKETAVSEESAVDNGGKMTDSTAEDYESNDQIDIPDPGSIETEESHASKKAKTKKKSIFSKLFSKNKKEDTDEITDELADILNETGSAFDDMALGTINASVGSAADFNASGKKGKVPGGIEGLDDFGGIDSLDDIPDKDEEKGKKKKEKKKKEKKIKPPKEKRIKKQKPPERDEYIRISPLSMVFSVSVIILLVIGIYFGSTTFSYRGKMDKATNYYVQKEYTKAYNLVAGMDIKSSDKYFYLQVENVMHVEKHINDFNSYIEVKKYALALEALAKGITDFDKYYDRGRELGTTQILDSKLDEIDTLLKTYYGLNVDEVREINLIDSISEYSEVINEKAQNIKIPSEEGTQ